MNEKLNEKIVDLVLNIHHFNQDVMELNIKYTEEIERLNNIIKEVREVVEEKCKEEYGGIAWYIKNILDKENKNE